MTPPFAAFFLGICIYQAKRVKNLATFVTLLFLTLNVCIQTANAESKTKPKKPVYAAYILDDATGKVFHKTNETTITHPASLTKVMTLYMLFEALKSKKVTLNTKMNVSQHASAQKPSKLWLKPGSTLTVRDAVMALTVKSANDVAVVVAEHLGGTETNFAAMMTSKAKQLGAQNTVYRTASGLPNRHEITTAKDQTIIFRALYRHFPSYWRYFSHKSFTFRGQRHPTHSRILNMCKGVDGLKTGFINASGFNLVISAKRDNARLFAVVMGGQTSLWRDKRMTNLMNSYFPKAIELNKHRTPERKVINTMLFARSLTIPIKPENLRKNDVDDVIVAAAEPPSAPPTPQKTQERYISPDADFMAALSQKPGKVIERHKATTEPAPDLIPASIDDIITASIEKTDEIMTGKVDVDSTDESDADISFVDGLPSQADADILSNIIANESYDDLDNLPITDQSWAAQFGAYPNEQDAQDRLNTLLDLIPDMPGDADISQANQRRVPLYRARVINISKDQAESICKKMRLHDVSCLPLKNQ